jgi:hypothetical protein
MIEASSRVSKAEIRRSLITEAAVPSARIAGGARRANREQPASFEALPVAFDLTDAEFGEHFLPWVRLACLCLRHDYSGVKALVRDMVRQGSELRLDETEQAWTRCAEMFGAIHEFVEAARVRLRIARAQIDGEDVEYAVRMSASKRVPRPTAERRRALGRRKKKANLPAVRHQMRSRKCASSSATASL